MTLSACLMALEVSDEAEAAPRLLEAREDLRLLMEKVPLVTSKHKFVKYTFLKTLPTCHVSVVFP